MLPLRSSRVPCENQKSLATFGVRVRILAFSLVAISGWALAEEDLPLPQWSEDEMRAFEERNMGAQSLEALLPERSEIIAGLDDYALNSPRTGPRLEELPDSLAGDLQPRLTMDHMRWFLPDIKIGARQETRGVLPAEGSAPTAAAALREVTPEFLKAACGVPGDLFFIDPDCHVPEMPAMELSRLLEFHARESRIRLYVLIIGKNEKLPASASVDQIASGRLLKTNACLLVYPVAEPWRAQLFVSQSVLDCTSQQFLAETAAEGVKQAMQSSEAHDQVESYLVVLSSRLFWLQKTAGKKLLDQESRAPLRELGSTVPAFTLPALSSGRAGSEIPWLYGSLMLGILVGGVWIGLKWRQRHLQVLKASIWLLPETDAPPRFGGAFCGGGGGMAKFG